MAGFCRVECLETWEQLLEDALYWYAWDEPCRSGISWRFLVVELILYVEWFGVAGLRVELLETLLDLSWNED